ncbi:MAG: ribbon-helix-helix domain-containing protein [Crocosphaera sp.]|jgi:metal-responsive CopG/Arc/MetJ family transcriptional regulator
MMKESTLRTTITLPKSLLEATDQRVKEGKAKNRNDFIALAVKKELEQLKRQEIDTALGEMAQDPEYQAQVLQMEGEFATAS